MINSEIIESINDILKSRGYLVIRSVEIDGDISEKDLINVVVELKIRASK